METLLIRKCFGAAAVRLATGLLSGAAAAGATSPAVTPHSQGLHGYISYGHESFPAQSVFTAGGGFYSAVWPLVDQPLAGFQIGLPGTWILPDNSDDKDTPLAPEGTRARTWKERGPTWSSVFQTVEGGLGILGGQSFPLRPAEVQHERHAAVLRLRSRLARVVFLLQQRGLAGPSTRHRAIEQSPAHPARRAAVSRPAERRVPRLHLDGAAVHRRHHQRSADG